MDNTTKFQSKFDLYEILRESGVDMEDTRYIVGAVNEHDGLVAEVERLKDSNSALQHNISVYKERLDNQYSNYTKELERLNCTIVISKNLTQQADNEVDRLEQENEKVKEELEVMINYHSTAAKFIESHKRFEQENEKLKEALRKCDPFIAHTGSRLHVCEFCFDNPHTDDCEYVKLTK